MTDSRLFSANLLLAYSAYLVATASPCPSNLAIMAIAMNSGRKSALLFALGVVSGSFFWAILAWIAIVSLALPPGASVSAALSVVAGCLCLGVLVFGGYALAFSTAAARRLYGSVRGWLEGALALVFGVAGIKLLMSRI